MIDIATVFSDQTTAFGTLAAVLSILAYLPYMVETVRGNTRPHRACWFIWSVLATISFFSQVYEGATASLGFAAAQAGCTSFVLILSFFKGHGALATRADFRALCVAAIGLVLWYLTESAVYALLISIAISLLGGSLTVIKTYHAPQTETMATWVLSLVASCFALATVGEWNWLLLAYPLYLFTLNGAIIVAWILGRWQKRSSIPRPIIGTHPSAAP